MAVISEHAASVLRTYGIGLSSEYTLIDGQPAAPKTTYPAQMALDLEGARKAADENIIKLSKKARKLLA